MNGPLAIGIGAPDRGDDEIGWLVLEHLESDVPYRRCSGDPAELADLLGSHDPVVIIDALRDSRVPGSIVLCHEPALLAPGSTTGSHSMGIPEALRLAEALGTSPRRLTVIGVAGVAFDLGDEMSPEVTAAAPRAAAVARNTLLAHAAL